MPAPLHPPPPFFEGVGILQNKGVIFQGDKNAALEIMVAIRFWAQVFISYRESLKYIFK